MAMVGGRADAAAGGYGGGDRPSPAKRRKQANGEVAPSSVTGRTRGRGRSRGRGGKGKGRGGKGVDMSGVYMEEGAVDAEEDEFGGFGALGRGIGVGAGATVLDGVVWKLGIDKVR